MKNIIKSNIKPDKDKEGSQVMIITKKEDDICIAIKKSSNEISQISLTYNQLCSLSRVIHKAINDHYQEYSNCMTKEKTGKIYIDDPIDW